MSSIKISVIIRTFNEERHVGLLLDMLKSQVYDHNQLEIIVVDSGSTDSTLEIVSQHKVRLIQLSKESFTYSKALNLGVENSTGEYIVILSAHAIPTDVNWLKGLISHFSDERVAGVYCRQVPWPDAPWDEKLRLEKTFPLHSHCFTAAGGLQGLHFSNAASCIRRQLWGKQPFVEIPAAEDYQWALWAINSQYKIIYDSDVSVFHSHNEPPRKSARRLIEIAKSADIALKRRRTRILTVRNSLGMMLKDIKIIARYEGCRGMRWSSLLRSFLRSVWFYRDFRYD